METKPTARKWYKKKRYIFSLIILGLIVVSGLNSDSSSGAPRRVNTTQFSASGYTAPTPLPSSYTTNSYKAPNTYQNSYEGLSNNNYYTNVDGNSVHSPAYSNSMPVGATSQCRDGTYSFSQHRQGTCSHHGGVSDWLY